MEAIQCQFEKSHFAKSKADFYSNCNLSLKKQNDSIVIFINSSVVDICVPMDKKAKIYETKDGISFRNSFSNSVFKFKKTKDSLKNIFTILQGNKLELLEEYNGKVFTSKTIQNDPKLVKTPEKFNKRKETIDHENKENNRKFAALSADALPTKAKRCLPIATNTRKVQCTPQLLPKPRFIPPIPSSTFIPDKNVLANKNVNIRETSQVSILGFPNLGHTCYVAVILQMVLNTRISKRIPSAFEYCSNNLNDSEKQKPFYRLLAALNDLIKNRMNGKELSVYELKSVLSEKSPIFKPYKQQDAHEFFNSLVNHISFNEIFNTKGFHDLDPCAELSIDIKNILQCTNCKHESTTIERTFDLSLPFSNHGGELTINNLINLYMRRERVEYNCSTCQSNQAELYHAIEKAPNTLVLHLGRFETVYKRDVTLLNKRDDRVSIPEEIQFHGCYRLKGIVAHIGTSSEYGHYVYYEKVGRFWTKYDDSFVTENMRISLASKTSYLVVYEK